MGLISTESMDLKPRCPRCLADVEILEVGPYTVDLRPCNHDLTRGEEQVMLDDLRYRTSLSDRDVPLPGLERYEERLRA